MTIDDELHSVFSYDPDTGIITWKKDISVSCRKGAVAGGFDKEGYLRIRYKGKEWRAHRVAWFLSYKKWPDHTIDHINQVKTDNRLINLRDVTQAENNKNMRRWTEGRLISRYSISGDLGVYFRPDRKRWRSRIKVNRVYISLGCFATREEAVAARREAEKLYR